MGKYTSDDADKLIQYFRQYTLEGVFLNEEFIDEYRKVHKKALGYLILLCEMEKQNESCNYMDERSIFYLRESVSDALQALFAWVNGAYKGADLLLRSSIENFNKAIIGKDNVGVYTEKSVYKIFGMAELLNCYQLMIGKEKIVEVLHRIYGELCKSTHTATSANMEHITALNMLPKFEKTKTVEFKKKYELLIDTYLGFFLGNYREVVEGMYRCNADIFYEVLPKHIIRSIVNG